MIIEIDKNLRKTVPQCSLGVIFADVTLQKDNSELHAEISRSIESISSQYTLEQVNHLPRIQELRSSYKILGKDPARYRGAAESLLRRVLQGKGLYKVNTIVDINNLVSTESLFSIGVYDLEKIEFPVVFRIGQPSEEYIGIGKSAINLNNLPVLADKKGPFGSSTSDSDRYMITEHTNKILMVVFFFSESNSDLMATLKRASSLLESFACASQIVIKIIN